MIFNLVVAGFEIEPSESSPVLFWVADAGIESTPFEREGRAMVTRGAGAEDVMSAGVAGVPGRQGVHRYDLLSSSYTAPSHECRPRNLVNVCISPGIKYSHSHFTDATGLP